MFTVKFYYFEKKLNSTSKPSSDEGYFAYSCRMLTDSSIISPVLLLASDNKEFQPDYSYCYIEKFRRYYFINDISWENGFWSI